ncbi:hypothetical protein FR773_25980 (plasmid) [Leclercia adecarboxylata]|uniref:hypothetical protein n=1 Tax=Leclercia adecarboxylata TaxID=83655 RepID=UPI0012AAB47A|nr:hypothetical protein [Leclercia adecarboxylata]QFH68085.1 hypothetical protein FR773_25980 [Leclercia adecarboxylata]
MRDLYLRFADAAEMQRSLLDFGFKKEKENDWLYHPDINLDVAGLLCEPIDAKDETLGSILLPGYHANLRVLKDELDMSALEQFTVNPETPLRVWA